MCCKKHSSEIETFDVWMVRTGKSKCGAGQPEASRTFEWGVPDPSFQWDLKDNSLCKSPALGTALCSGQTQPCSVGSAPLGHHTAWWHLFTALSAMPFPSWSSGAANSADPKGLNLQPPLNPGTCWVWGSPFPWGPLTTGDYSDEHGENDQENSRKFF